MEVIKVEVIRAGDIVAHDTIVEHPVNVSLDQWKDFGSKLRGAERFIQWYLGYWWNYGHKKWSREAEEFAEKLGYKPQSLRLFGSVYENVKPLIRINTLSFNHHRLVAPCEPPKQREWLKQAHENTWTVAELRKAMKAEIPQPELPEGVWDVLYADPPWKYDNSGLKGAAEEHYKVMEVEEIYKVDVAKIAAPNSVLFCWVTNPFLKDGFAVLDAWGFDYKTNLCWVKEGRATYGKLGFYVYGRHELLLIATKGSCLPDGEIPESVIQASKGIHSRKPDVVYDMIEKMYPREKYVELFARIKHSDKWTVFGDEV